jgi:CRISPR-associated protein Cas2
MKKELFVVIAYDIVSDKRRKKVVKMLKDYGGRRMNYSVFECRMEKTKFQLLRESLLDLIQEKKDCVLIYELCEVCKQKIFYMGAVQPSSSGGPIVIL